MKLEKAKSIAEFLMWLGLVPQWIFMTSRGVPGGLLIAIFIMPILMIMTFVSFMMYVFLQGLGSPFCCCSSRESLDIDKKGLVGFSLNCKH